MPVRIATTPKAFDAGEESAAAPGEAKQVTAPGEASPWPEVMEAYQASHAQFGPLYQKLSQ
jgi:hypothetical protein